MKISIITVSYNSAATIEETIQSVLAQNYKDIEFIVIDGNSNDGTQDIVSKYMDNISYFISEKDTGIYDAMNKGLALATGDVIGILNSDDIYKNDQVLSNIASEFDDQTDCVCTDVEIFDGTPQHVIRYYNCTRWKPWMFRIGHQPPHPGFFVKKSMYQLYGNFRSHFRLAADFDILLRFIAKNKARVKYCHWVSVSMRSGGASQKSFKNINRANREVNESLKTNGYFSILPLIWLKYPFKIFQFLLK